MTYRLVAATVLLLVAPVLAVDGQPGIHDSSTVVIHAGRYVYRTGTGLPMLVSDDGWIGEQYFLSYSAPGTQPKSAVGLLVGTTLDPDSPGYKWEDGGPVVWSDAVEDNQEL